MATTGYRIKLHNALVTPIMLGGVPRRFAILNGTICAAFVLGLQAVYMLPIFMTKRDPYFFDVVLRHIKKKKYYKV
jgi:type IV secretion system protein VirB3